MKKISIKEPRVNREIKEYLKPEYIYIEVNDKILVENNTYIKKGELITNNQYSPISGIIRGITYKNNIHNKKTKYLIIENDYKEKTIRKINNNNLLVPSKTKYILINGIDEIYTSIKRSIISKYSNFLLEYIDIITTNLKINKIYICISNNDNTSYYKLNKYLKMHPNIEIIRINNFYLNNNNNILIKEVFGYNKENIFIIDSIDLYRLINLNNYTNIITIGGSNIQEKGNIKVKEGTLLKDVIHYLGGYKNKDNVSITINGVLGGTSVNSDDIIIDKKIHSVFITKKIHTKENTCTNCSKCVKVCPVHLVPVYILNNNKKINIDKCLECGLCSYVCPSNINLTKHIKEAKENHYNE